MEQTTAPSKTALVSGITAIVGIAAKDVLTVPHLISIAIIAVLVAVYIFAQGRAKEKAPRNEQGA